MAMTRYLGLASFVAGVSSWALYGTALVFGGLDPPASDVPFLRGAVTISLGLGIAGAAAGIVAIVRGRQRLAAAAGLALALLYLLAFTGLAFVPFALFGSSGG